MNTKDFLLGFDIGGTKCAVCVGNLSGKPADKIQFPTASGFYAVWQDLKSNTYRLLETNDIPIENIVAIGISCGGPLDSKRGVVQSPPNLPGWDDIPIVKVLEDEFRTPVFLMNDANACALAEWRFGAGEYTDNMIFLTMGTGLGGGLILNGELYEGASGMAGEIGHIRLLEDGPIGFGKAGSFEGFCGGNGISQNAKAIAATFPDQNSVEEYIKIAGGGDFSVKSLDVAQAKGNEFAGYMFKTTGTMLGKGLAILIDVFNPAKIVIGSIFERSESIIRPTMEKALEEEALPQNLKACQILPAALGDKIGDYACLLVAKHGLQRTKRKR